MKWKAERISELVSGYGELWSSQILAALLSMRANAAATTNTQPSSSLQTPSAQSSISEASSTTTTSEQQQVLPPPGPPQPQLISEEVSTTSSSPGTQQQHEFVYLDARRVIIIDEDAIQNGSVCWDISQTKLRDVYEEVVLSSSQKRASAGAISGNNSNCQIHFVMTGYVASNTHGVATTLQRDGSDYSAAIMGRLLQASSITIWTDGMYKLFYYVWNFEARKTELTMWVSFHFILIVFVSFRS